MAEEQTYINHSPTAPTGGLVEASRPSISGYRTILDDATNYHVKHPLQSHWTLHQKLGAVEGASSRGVSQDAWADSLKDLYKSMQDVTTIPSHCDYFFMREAVKPMWEDPANVGGCEWRISLTRNMNIPDMWKLLLAVGCQLKDYQYLTGVQFAYRGSGRSRISLWLAAAPSDVRERIRASGLDTPTSIRIDLTEFTSSTGGGSRGDRRDRGDRGERRDREGGWSRGGGGRPGSGGRPHRGGGGESPRDREDRRRPF